MVYDKTIEGKFVKLRSITLEDAEFSYNLRRDPRFVDIMGQPAKTIEDQKKFIEWQMKQPGDYYFVVLNRCGEKIGLIGVYDIRGDSCEVGREINTGAPYESLETEILINDFIIDTLELRYKRSIIYKHNKKQLELQKQKGITPVEEVIRNGIPSFVFNTDAGNERVYFEKIHSIIAKLALKGGF